MDNSYAAGLMAEQERAFKATILAKLAELVTKIDSLEQTIDSLKNATRSGKVLQSKE